MSDKVTTVEIAASPEAVRAAILDLEGYPTWQREMKKVTVLKRDDAGRPRTVAFDIAVAGQAANYTLEFSYPAPDTIKSTLIDGSLITKQDQIYVLTDLGGKTRLEYQLDIDIKWPVPDFMLTAIVNKGVKTNVAGIKKNAEAR
ncbi:SRPBCC family protein [Sporichthya brevicatena]|uniref:SRPBCC family protein n=1 Tax=Sporichthya brevicatena TaxID=171442 RepID=A0ABP3RR77_9ACTN